MKINKNLQSTQRFLLFALIVFLSNRSTNLLKDYEFIFICVNIYIIFYSFYLFSSYSKIIEFSSDYYYFSFFSIYSSFNYSFSELF